VFQVRKTIKIVFTAVCILLPSVTLAQTFPVFEDSLKIGVVNQEVLFTGSHFGKSKLKVFESSGAILTMENIAIQEELEQEERTLTELRKTIEVAAFQELALDFDAKVKKIRATQARKERDLNIQLSKERAAFFEQISPILLTFVQERGIEVLLNKETVVLAVRGSDITQAAIQRINEVLKEN